MLLAVAAVEIALSVEPSEATRSELVAVALIATTALAWRRRAPVVSAMIVLTVLTVMSALWQTSGLWLALVGVLSTYSVAAHAALVPAAVAGAVWLGAGTLAVAQENNRSAWEFLGNFLFLAVFLAVGPWVAGRMIRRRQLRAALLERRATEAVAEERQRIARELHDVVGHALGVIVVQAGAERATLTDASTSTRETLLTIERASREALAEMRRLLDLMRLDHDPVALAPQPSLAQLPALVEKVRAAGLPVEVNTEGERHALPPGVDLSAYRIVQEALTNALKHAGPARARVNLRYGTADLELEITDDGVGAASAGPRNGHGLIGMRERVALHRGSLETGARPGGGYLVSVRLPYAP